MRLLHIDTLQLEEFVASPPPYIALSHTWGKQEITLQELHSPDFRTTCRKEGWIKILDFCQAVKKYQVEQRENPVQYVWVDTCCIDKTSSAELSEAINSMFRWYRESEICFAFLDDVQYDGGPVRSHFSGARWFTRGFTLQELLAPTEVQFFDKRWHYIGSRKGLSRRISKVTRIPSRALKDGEFQMATVAQILSWAAHRQTTRPEDIAYCLLGLFNVNMPLLYGEGDKAFIRLQEEILKESEDQSIFAWDASTMSCLEQHIGVLAPSPKYFSACGRVAASRSLGIGEVSISNKGITINLPTSQDSDLGSAAVGDVYMVTSCYEFVDKKLYRLGIDLVKSRFEADRYERASTAPRRIAPFEPEPPIKRLTLTKQSQTLRPCSVVLRNVQRDVHGKLQPWKWKEGFPNNAWEYDEVSDILRPTVPEDWRSAIVRHNDLYAYAVFEWTAGQDGRAMHFALELCFSQARLRCVRLLDLTKAFACSANKVLAELIDEADFYCSSKGQRYAYNVRWKDSLDVEAALGDVWLTLAFMLRLPPLLAVEFGAVRWDGRSHTFNLTLERY